MSSPRPLIFCDFDGTIARTDVGYRMFHHFSGGRNDALLPDWKAGRMSSREILLREAEMVHATPEQIYAFIDTMEIDPTFPAFVALAEANGITPVVLSEGLDFYISYLLQRAGLGRLPMMTNQGHLENGGIRIAFPYRNRQCRTCGSCKGERIDEYRKKAGGSRPVVFVGDGYSDACAARRADVLFAKKDLAKYCRAEKIAYTLYDTFENVADDLMRRGLLTKYRIDPERSKS